MGWFEIGYGLLACAIAVLIHTVLERLTR